MTGPVNLYTCARRRVALGDALLSLGEQTLLGLIYTPTRCGLVRLSGGTPDTGPARLDLAQAFEARFFNRDLELRWLRDPEGQGEGCAVCLAETPLALPGWDTQDPTTDLERLDGQYLLVGQGCAADGLPADWSALSSAAIGTWGIPLPNLGDGARAALHYVEYLGRVSDADGDWVAIEERLVDLKDCLGQRQ